MPYYTGDENDVDDFDEFDPTPYSGGYDITVIYGRPVPPSDETCYSLSSATDGDFEYERPEFTSIHEPSAYGDEALQTEYSSYSRRKPRPAFRPDSSGGHVQGEYGGRTNPDYGGRSETEYDRKTSYGRSEEDEGSHRKPSYVRRNDDDDDDEKRRNRFGDDEEGSYGRKKYGGNDSGDDEERKQHHYKNHYHSRRDEDD